MSTVFLNVRFESKADMCSAKGHVCFTPHSGHWPAVNARPLGPSHAHSQSLDWAYLGNPAVMIARLGAAPAD
jgi:hypothetical protein